MEQNIIVMIFVVFAVFFIILIFCIVYFMRREKILLNRIQKMLDDAIEGKFQDRHLDESKISIIENNMWRYLCDNYVANENILKEKEQIQEMISNISHQTVLSIANIMLYSQLIEEVIVSQKNCCSYGLEELASLREETEKLDFLIEGLVKLSRLEKGIIHVNVQKQNVNIVLSAIQKQFMAKAYQKGIRFMVNNTEEMAVFDLKWTIEAVANVVDNAIKYTQCSGDVEVSVKSYAFFVCIDVKDSGIGIKEAEQANIFKRFYRSSEVSNEAGTGIGLYITREVMRAQSGYVKLLSKVGEGSTFSLFLPKDEMSQK